MKPKSRLGLVDSIVPVPMVGVDCKLTPVPTTSTNTSVNITSTHRNHSSIKHEGIFTQ